MTTKKKSDLVVMKMRKKGRQKYPKVFANQVAILLKLLLLRIVNKALVGSIKFTTLTLSHGVLSAAYALGQ